ncbi:hypothetical protein FQR65_LT10952 [Abscondita terminalis]|nr:hypothetical protein FQR65_LT10952 [Abscondita terminalis]
MTDVFDVPKDLQKIARAELNEIPNRVKNDIAYIRNWLLEQHHLIARTDDHTLLVFLRYCKFSLEETKTKIDLYYSIKTAFPRIFTNRDPFQPKFQYILQNNIVSFLPKLSNGPVLLLVRVANGNPDIFSVEDALKFGLLLADIMFRFDVNSNIVGHALLVDLKDIPTKYFLQITPTFIKKVITCFVNVYPLSIKAVYFINVPSSLLTAFNILKSFLSSKLKDRFFCYGSDNLNVIQKHYPACVMPTEYGGEAGPFADLCAQLKAIVETYREWIIDDEQYLCIEEKRPLRTKHDIDLFSVDGFDIDNPPSNSEDNFERSAAASMSGIVKITETTPGKSKVFDQAWGLAIIFTMSKISELPNEIHIMAKNELNAVPEQVEQDISYIREWLLKQPHINARTDDHSILIFLRACKFSLEKTKNKLELFYTVKTAFSDTFANRDPLDYKIEYFFKKNFLTLLPRTLNGPILILFNIGSSNPDHVSVYDGLRIGTVMLDVILQEFKDASVVGQAMIVDLKNCSKKYIMQITPTFLKQAVTCLQDGYPVRVKAINFINVPQFLFSAFNILKSFLPKKLQERVTLDPSGDKSSTSLYFPLTVLPAEYGGTAGPLTDMCEKSRMLVVRYRQWFLEDKQYRCIEERRPISSKRRFDLFSIDGSFRKLEVD